MLFLFLIMLVQDSPSPSLFPFLPPSLLPSFPLSLSLSSKSIFFKYKTIGVHKVSISIGWTIWNFDLISSWPFQLQWLLPPLKLRDTQYLPYWVLPLWRMGLPPRSWYHRPISFPPSHLLLPLFAISWIRSLPSLWAWLASAAHQPFSDCAFLQTQLVPGVDQNCSNSQNEEQHFLASMFHWKVIILKMLLVSVFKEKISSQ